MLSHVEFKNYRGFATYRMDGVAQVNLLVGKNNSGKTSLLEGIQFLASGGSPSVLEEVAIRRGELIISSPDRPLVDPCHFFHGHVLTPNLEIEVRGDNGHKPVKMKVVATKTKQIDTDVEKGSRTRYSSAVLRIEGGANIDSDELKFRLTRDGGVEFESVPRSRRLGLFQRLEGPAVRFISTDSIDIRTLAGMWDEITLNGLENEVAEALRILDNDLVSVHMLSGMTAYGYYGGRAGAVVGLRGDRQRVPLGSMGDGMRRMLALATSLACTRGGSLFADEIDTGLHYSVMCDMWKLVVKRALSANVQVFATTHSWDCIEGLAELCQNEPALAKLVAVHTIDRGLPHSVAFQGDSVQRMAKHHIDPR